MKKYLIATNESLFILPTYDRISMSTIKPDLIKLYFEPTDDLVFINSESLIQGDLNKILAGHVKSIVFYDNFKMVQTYKPTEVVKAYEILKHTPFSYGTGNCTWRCKKGKALNYLEVSHLPIKLSCIDLQGFQDIITIRLLDLVRTINIPSYLIRYFSNNGYYFDEDFNIITKSIDEIEYYLELSQV